MKQTGMKRFFKIFLNLVNVSVRLRGVLKGAASVTPERLFPIINQKSSGVAPASG